MIFIHINKLQPQVREREWGRYSDSWVHQGVRDVFQGQLTLVLQPHFISPPQPTPSKRRMSEENFHTSSGHDSAFLRTRQFMWAAHGFFTWQWNLSLKMWFPFLLSRMEASSPGSKYRNFKHLPPGHALRLPLLPYLSWVYFQIQCPIPNWVSLQAHGYKTQFTFTFLQIPWG